MSLTLRIDPEEYIQKYRDSGNEYWLAIAARNYLHHREPLPDAVADYVDRQLSELVRSRTQLRRKAKTQDKRERYQWRVFVISGLTGCKPEDAIERIRLVDEAADIEGVPTEDTLTNWWYNRPASLKRAFSNDDLSLLDIDDTLAAAFYEQSCLEFSVLPERQLRILPEIIERLPEPDPNNYSHGRD
jgi:hypothetical protein